MTDVTSEPRLYVSVDFGTSYSGVAAVYSASPDVVEIIRSWPGGNGVSSDKVPTQFTYAIAGNSANSRAPHDDELRMEMRWGYEVNPNEDQIRCIKLFLQDNFDHAIVVPDFISVPSTLAHLAKHARNVDAAIADFLKALLDHTLETLSKRWGEPFIQTTKIEYILTVPAIWSQSSKHRMRRAAKRAGFGDNVKMISEPEAAAIHTLAAIQPNHLRVGDNMIVTDSGGGTVDLISYEITNLSPLQVEESTIGTGGLCGATFLNAGFEQYVESRLGYSTFQQYKDEKPRAWAIAMNHWESTTKRWFGSTSMTEFEIPFAGMTDNAAAGIEDGCLILTSDQVRSIFQPIVDEVVALVDQQVNSLREQHKRVAAVLLVGGFGMSAFLYNTLKGHYQTDLPPPYSRSSTAATSNSIVSDPDHATISVLQPTNAWSACLRGALQRALDDTIVVSRKARYHYGIMYDANFDASIHPESCKYYDEHFDVMRARHAMKWTLGKGEDVTAQRELKFPFQRGHILKPQLFEGKPGPFFTEKLHACAQNVAPVMYNAATMIEVCSMVVDLTNVPRTLFVPRTNAAGETRWWISYELVMTVDSASINFEMRIGEVSYGSVSASFNH